MIETESTSQTDRDLFYFTAAEDVDSRHQTPCQIVTGEASPAKFSNTGQHQQWEQFKPLEVGNHVGQLLDVVSGSATYSYPEYDDSSITTNWDCQDSSSNDFSPHSGVYFIPYSSSSSDCCLGNRATHFQHQENKHIKRNLSSPFPSAEIPLKMVVGNHHSSQQKLHFSRHLLQKRCFRSSSNRSTSKQSMMKQNKTKADKRDLSEAKSVVKSGVLRVKPSNVEVIQSSDSIPDDEDGDLSQGDRRQIANARERQRVSHLNEGFDKLRRVLPWMRRSRRVSKVDTLRGAIAYIKYLQQQVWTRDLTGSGCVDCLGAYCLPRSAIGRPMSSSYSACYIKTHHQLS